MTKISNKSSYPIDNSLTGQEFLVGTDDNGQTMSYTLGDIAALVLDVDPSTIDNTSITVKEVVFGPLIDNQTNIDGINNATQFSIGLKEVCILTSVDGDIKYLLKLGSGVYGSGGTQITESDLITIFDTSAGLVTSVNGEVGDVDVDVKVASVTGDGVNNTDPDNPVLSFPTAEDINAAPLVDGLIPSQYIPGGVDEILEYTNFSSFPTTGLEGKIYLDLTANITYRWGGTVYVAIGGSLSLGETSTTAHRGDHGKLAYDRSTYTNETPMPQAVGGLSAGTSFNAQTVKQVLDGLLYPYQSPSFNLFQFKNSHSSNVSNKEIGQELNLGTSRVFRLGASNTQNISNITIKENGVTVLDSVSYPSSNEVTITSSTIFSRDTIGSITMYTLTGENNQGGSISNPKTIAANWRARIYYGRSTSDTATESLVKGLEKSELHASTPYNIVKNTTSGPGYLYVAIPKGILSGVKLYDEGGANNVPQTVTTINITNAYGLSMDYDVYRSNNYLNASNYSFILKQ